MTVPPLTITHGGAPHGWLELSANVNPCGTPDPVRLAIAGASYSVYADLDTAPAEEHLARDAQVAPSELLLTAGATEGLRLVCGALLGPGDHALVVGPAYGELARVARLRGAAVSEHRVETGDFRPDLGQLAEDVARCRPRAIFLCDPNNPTAAQLSADGLAALIEIARGATVIVDQSFLPFGEPTLTAERLLGTGAVLLRSLTKVLAAPGVRVGYVLAPAEVIAALRELRDPWTIGAHAIAAAGVASFSLDGATSATLGEWRARFVRGLRARGFALAEPHANFVLARPPRDAAVMRAQLARQCIAVRGCADFGLPDHLRLAVRPPEEQDIFFTEVDADA